MATTKSPAKDSPGPAAQTPSKSLLSSPNPITPPFKPELPTDPRQMLAAASLRPTEPSSTSDAADFALVPSYSRWFSWKSIHECEVRFLPEFFDSRSASKNPTVYKYYRNSIVKLFRENPSRKITFTEVRKTLVGDVGSIRRVFDFLDAWGLINYSGTTLNKPLKWEEKDSKVGGGTGLQGDVGGSVIESSAPKKEMSKRVCSGCKSVCSIACFACDKYDLTLCARCYVRGNYRVGVSSSDFRRVEISDETKADWTEKETLLLLEAVTHYGDDWKKVAQHVNGRSEKECVSHFITLPFGEEFIGHLGSGDIDSKDDQIKENIDSESELESIGTTTPSKRMRLTPLADASNPIMAQAAFLSAVAGVEVAEAAARAAVTALSEMDYRASRDSLGSLAQNKTQLEADVASNGDTAANAVEGACVEAHSLLEKEELELEQAISGITDVQMREIQNKILRFEELELQIEKNWQQVEQMKNLLFIDQLTLLFHKSSAPKTGEAMVEQNVRVGL